MNGIRITWSLTSFIGILFLSILLFIVGALLIGKTPLSFPPVISQPPTEEPMPTATSPPLAAIGGRVWHDLCVSGAEGQPSPASALEGCISISGSGYEANGIQDPGEPGIDGVLLRLGVGTCPAIGQTMVISGEEGEYLFSDVVAGTYCISIDTMETKNRLRLIPGAWTYPNRDQGTAAITVTVAPGEENVGVNFGWDYQFLPEPDPSPTVTPPPTPSVCTNEATYIQDVTIPDNANLRPGESFEKIWRLKNSGSCTWDQEYALVFSSGLLMEARSYIPLSSVVAPGASIDLKVNMVSPSSSGIYRGNWMLRSKEGGYFGIGDNARQAFWVQIVVGPSGSMVSGVWRGEYYKNASLNGLPAFTRADAVINFDWKRTAPTLDLPADNFSVRWSGTGVFDSGTYRFRVIVDDGARLWVDNKLIIDAWKDGGGRELTVDLALAKGKHELKLEYYDRTAEALIRLSWEKVPTPKFSDWKAEYWDNRDLSGSPVLVRNDKSLNFNWGKDSPAVGVPKDNFSARWTRTINFESGLYRFTVRADDGVRVYIDGKIIINEWHQSNASEPYTVDKDLSGQHSMVVEYHERGEYALVIVEWVRVEITPTPTSTPGPTGTPTPTPTATTTPEPTATLEPTVTPTPTETSLPAPEMAFDFSENFCAAMWKNGSGVILPCPGQAGDLQGSILLVEDPMLESGVEADAFGLLTSPENVHFGWIEGTFPAFTVQAGDRFRAVLGCLHNQVDCSITFELNLRLSEDGPLYNMKVWEEKYDGQVVEVDIDLTKLAGRDVIFIFSVYAENPANQNVGVWLNPGIWR